MIDRTGPVAGIYVTPPSTPRRTSTHDFKQTEHIDGIHQAIILGKLIKFIELTNPSKTQKFQALFDGGRCFGFSTTFCLMANSSKLAWWSAAKIAIVSWDENASTLSQVSPLLEGETDSTLGALFRRVLKYVAKYPAELDSKIINPNKRIEVIAPNGNIELIKQLKIIGGNFDQFDIVELLDEKNIEDNVCLICSPNHALGLSYISNTWVLHDPNYDKEFYKVFYNIEFVVNEIIKILGNALSIHVASFSNDKIIEFPYYEHMLKTKLSSLTIGFGLALMARYVPEHLENAVDSTAESKAGCDQIADALVAKCGEITAFDSIWRYTRALSPSTTLVPQSFVKIIKYCLTAAHGLEMVLKVLSEKDESGSTGWHNTKFYVTKHVSFFGKMIRAKASPVKKAILDAIATAINKIDTNTLERVVNHLYEAYKSEDSVYRHLSIKPSAFCGGIKKTNISKELLVILENELNSRTHEEKRTLLLDVENSPRSVY
ncbi:MAG: hypothetical protein ABI597_14045 [Gammaproteobacteria bacterium]